MSKNNPTLIDCSLFVANWNSKYIKIYYRDYFIVNDRCKGCTCHEFKSIRVSELRNGSCKICKCPKTLEAFRFLQSKQSAKKLEKLLA